MADHTQGTNGSDPVAQSLGQRVRGLVEALPAIQALSGSTVVIKYGGAVMDDPALGDRFAQDVVLLGHLGLKPVIVHGGGPALTRMMTRLGIESRFVDGHRVTTDESARLAQMVLSGSLNKEVVARLARAGARAVGLSGVDGGVLRVRKHEPGGRDIGFVGLVESVDPAPLHLLTGAGYVPVLSTTACDPLGQAYNINADVVAGAVAAALGAARLVFLSDVAGLQVGGERVPVLGATQARAFLAGPDVTGGMRPKIEGAIAAVEGGVPRVHLVDGRVIHALLIELFYDSGRGTLVVPDALAPETLTVALPGEAARPTAVAAAPPVALADAGRPGQPEWAGTLGERGARAVMQTYKRYPVEVASAEGAWITGSDGRRYLDFVAGIAVNVLGHGHPAVVGAIAAATRGPLHISNLYWSEPMVRLAERLTAAAGMDRAFFCNSGAEAIETGLKLARKARPGRGRTVVFDRSFHGRTFGALSATMQPAYQDPFRPLLAGVTAVPYGDFDAAAAAIDDGVAAVLVEPIQGEGGVRPAPAGFLTHLRKACDRSGALLIVDEVQTGLGRTGQAFACGLEGVKPDAMAVAKALAGGLPMGALLARGDAAQALGPGEHGSTFGGGPFVSSVALAVLDTVLAPGFLAAVAARGEQLGSGLHALGLRHPALVAEVRGRGLMWGMALHGPWAADLVQELLALGLLGVPAGKDVLRLLPPLIVSPAEIDTGLGLIGQGLDRLAARRAAEGQG